MEPLEDILGGVLDTAERGEKSRNKAYVFSVILEGTLLVAFLLVMDFGDRLHWLLLIATWLASGTIAALMLVLAAHINLNTLHILKAIELLDHDDDH